MGLNKESPTVKVRDNNKQQFQYCFKNMEIWIFFRDWSIIVNPQINITNYIMNYNLDPAPNILMTDVPADLN